MFELDLCFSGKRPGLQTEFGQGSGLVRIAVVLYLAGLRENSVGLSLMRLLACLPVGSRRCRVFQRTAVIAPNIPCLVPFHELYCRNTPCF